MEGAATAGERDAPTRDDATWTDATWTDDEEGVGRGPEPPPAGMDLDEVARRVVPGAVVVDAAEVAEVAERTNAAGGDGGAPEGGRAHDHDRDEGASRARRWLSDRVNPCYVVTAGRESTESIRCVPYFYILGSFHSGALDVFERLKAHPKVVAAEEANDAVGGDGAGKYFSEVHNWDRALHRGCDFGSCPRSVGAAARGGVPPPPAMVADKGAVFGEASGGAFTFTFSLTHSLLHAAWDKNMSDCWHAGFQGPRNHLCFAPGLRRLREWERSVGGGEEPGRLQLPWVMRAVHGTRRVRLVAILRDPAERTHSAFWFWPQYRRRYGATPEGFLAYVQEVLPPLRDCFEKHGVYRCATEFEALGKAYEQVYYHCDQLLKSLYAPYLGEWRRAFGARRVLVMHAESYWADPARELSRALTFLGLEAGLESIPSRTSDADTQEPGGGGLKEDWRSAMLGRKVATLVGTEFEGRCGTCGDFALTNRVAPRDWDRDWHERDAYHGGGGRGRASRIQAPMLPRARELLDEFFAPFNRQLARELGDDRFLWRTSPE